LICHLPKKEYHNYFGKITEATESNNLNLKDEDLESKLDRMLTSIKNTLMLSMTTNTENTGYSRWKRQNLWKIVLSEGRTKNAIKDTDNFRHGR
jgi:hypothetical protein